MTDIDIDKALLTAEDLSKLEIEVQKEIDKELKEKTRESVKKELLQAARTQRGLSEQQEQVGIDLPMYADRIAINGNSYLQGLAYTVKASVAILLRESMQRAWQHQAEVEGRSRNWFQRRRATALDGSGGVRNAPFMRV
jgi:tRNA U38,U39,U40 pseudouridine synthase TruA